MFSDIQDAAYEELSAIREALGLGRDASRGNVLEAIEEGQAALAILKWLKKQPLRCWPLPIGCSICSGIDLIRAIHSNMSKKE